MNKTRYLGANLENKNPPEIGFKKIYNPPPAPPTLFDNFFLKFFLISLSVNPTNIKCSHTNGPYCGKLKHF